MQKRFITRIELTPECRQRLTSLHKSAGMTQVAVLSRMVEWLSGQPDTIQAIVLGQIPASIERDVAALLLERIAGGKGAARAGRRSALK